MSIQAKSLNQITQQAIEILSKEIGVANTVRFINQFSMGYGNYTEERENLFKDLTLDDIVRRCRAANTALEQAEESL
jgi:hypothetical protein